MRFGNSCLISVLLTALFFCTGMAAILANDVANGDAYCIEHGSILLDQEKDFQRGDTKKIEYVKSKYEHSLFGLECIFYPAKNPKRLIISFNGAVKSMYHLWSWFWEDSEDWDDTAYLFLKDDSFSWYLGNNERSLIDDYIEIIKHFISKTGLSHDKVITLGISMGGYAAILYATILELRGAIAFNPQVNKDNSEATHGAFLISNAEDRWVDLDKVIASVEKVPFISLNFGNDCRDEGAAFRLLDELKRKNSATTFHRGLGKKHWPIRYNKKFIESEIQYFDTIESIGDGRPTVY